LEFCATRQRSRIRVSSGNGYATPESVARQWRIDPEHAQIGVTATADTPFVATPGGHASWGMRAPYASPRRAAALETAPTPPIGSLACQRPRTASRQRVSPPGIAGAQKGWGWEPDPGIPTEPQSRSHCHPLTPCGPPMPCAAGSSNDLYP